MADVALLRETLAGVAEAVEEERRASAADPTSRIQLRDGRLIGRVGSHHLWSFEYDGDVTIEAESGGELQVSGRDLVTVTVLAVGDLDLVLSVRDELGDSIGSAVLIAQPLFILESLRRRLESATEQLLDVSLLEQVLDLAPIDEDDVEDDDDPTRPSQDEFAESAEPQKATDIGLSYEQLVAVEHTTKDGLRFVWGPPGTGKTSTLAATVAALADAGRRVIVVAHSNAAIDVAMVRVASFMAGSPLLDEGRVLRVGTPHLADARDCKSILPDEIIAKRFPELGDHRRTLERRRDQLSGALRAGGARSDRLVHELDTVRRSLAEIDVQLDAEVSDLINQATVIGCTLSKIVIDSQLWSWHRDGIVVDEASMAGLPFVMALAAGAPRTLACFGDFRQLPPIAISERPAVKAWFGRDVFELSGVVSRVENGERDPRLAILRTQYRMGEAIASAVSEVAYFSLLSSHVDAIERAYKLAALAPLEGQEVAIVDTSGLKSVCLQEAAPNSFSRYNLRSAALVTTLAYQAHRSGLEVGVISPYRAQVAVLAALSRTASDITAATMHRFQGSERDAIIVDLVDASPERGPSRLTGKDENLALRLLNVGISRAKGKLLIVVDLPFLRDRSPRTSPALQFINAFLEGGAPVIAAENLIGSSAPSVAWSSSWWEAVRELATTSAPSEIQIGINDLAFADDGLNDKLRELTALGHRLTVHAPIEAASQLDSGALELRLLPLSAGQIAVSKGWGVVVGGSRPDEPAATLRGAAVTATVQRLLQREA